MEVSNQNIGRKSAQAATFFVPHPSRGKMTATVLSLIDLAIFT
jgi:hypothetical protein